MDESSYHTWWALHLRVARGDNLNSEEQKIYEAGLAQLHQSENLAGDVASLREARATVQTLETELARLHARREQLDAEIAALEAALDVGTSERLAMKD